MLTPWDEFRVEVDINGGTIAQVGFAPGVDDEMVVKAVEAVVREALVCWRGMKVG